MEKLLGKPNNPITTDQVKNALLLQLKGICNSNLIDFRLERVNESKLKLIPLNKFTESLFIEIYNS